MKEPFYTYRICSDCGVSTEAPALVGEHFVKTLDALRRIDPFLAHWQIIDVRALSSLPLALARSRIARIIADNVVRDDFDAPDPDCGYHASARTKIKTDPRNVSFVVHAGGKRDGNTRLEFGEHDVPPDLTVINFSLFKAALLAICAVWLPHSAFACAHRSGAVLVPFESVAGGVPFEAAGAQAFLVQSVPQIPGDPTFPDSRFQIPWLAYLSAPLAAGLRMTPEILSERTPDGGLLMSATTDRLDPTNPDHVRRARILAETLIACTG